jgi:hypothetical protein
MSEVEEMEFIAVPGGPAKLKAEPEPGGDSSGPGGRRERLLRVLSCERPLPGGADRLLQRRVAVATGTQGSWDALDALDSEIRIGIHLGDVFERAGLEYPQQLSRLVGYNVEAREPYALFLPYRADSCAQWVGRVLSREEESFQEGLIRALRLLEAAGVAHLGISPRTVLWSGETSFVQLVDFSRALLFGEQWSGARNSPWLAPGTGSPVGGRDDVYSAGAVLYHVVTGKPFEEPESVAADIAARGGSLQSLLQGVFADPADARPTAANLVERLRMRDPWPASTVFEDGDGFETWRLEFDRKLARKRPQRPAPAAVAAQRPRPPRGRRLPWRLLLVCAALAAAAIAIMEVVK